MSPDLNASAVCEPILLHCEAPTVGRVGQSTWLLILLAATGDEAAYIETTMS